MKYPLIIEKDSALDKYDAPGKTVTVSLPAFIRSASTSLSCGYGPRPRIPFSLWKVTAIFFGM